MRAHAVAVLLAFASVPALAACFDLFHSTDDIQSACELDASIDGCASPDVLAPAPDASDDTNVAPTAYDTSNFCRNDSATAYHAAERACQLLGTCNGPIGNNQFARCMVHALMAYDCLVSPERNVIGAAHDYWKCVADAKSCTEVRRCSPANCNQTPAGVGCAGNVLRAECSGSGGDAVQIEDCVAWGQGCGNGDAGTICMGPSGASCPAPGCDGTKLTDCDETSGDNVGVDCADYGDGRCVTGANGKPACKTSGRPCAASDVVTCDAGVAYGCASGFSESVNCRLLNTGTCGSAPSPVWKLASACFPNTLCAPDLCDGKTLKSCYAGVVYTTVCSSGCALVTTPDGSRAACNP